MPTAPPELCDLEAGLRAVFGGAAEVVERRPNPFAGKLASEVVTLRLADGRALQVFAKSGAPPAPDLCGRQGGVAYEADVYRALPGLPLRSHGAAAGWLFLDYLADAVRVSKAPRDAGALGLAAGWVGGFHAAHEGGVPEPLVRYDADYYVRWARRAVGFAAGRYPWLPDAARGYKGLAEFLAGRPATITHGDYYADNVLYRDGAVYPVDWGWAAVTAGEIDLASLTERWPAADADRCERAYAAARWPGGIPADFPAALAAARVYLCFRWLGHRPDWADDEKRRWRFELLRDLADRLGLI
jgi:hypothetical protein